MLEGPQDLCSSQICIDLFNFLQRLVHGLLGVLHTFTAMDGWTDRLYIATYLNLKEKKMAFLLHCPGPHECVHLKLRHKTTSSIICFIHSEVPPTTNKCARKQAT